MTYKICAIIPTYNHHHALNGIIQKLREKGLDVFIIDDGSSIETEQMLQSIAHNASNVHLLRLSFNQGKGAAIKQGLQLIEKKGYSHAFQIDADGQHSLANLEGFLNISQKNPQALVSGHPLYDESIPFSRKVGRWLTHVWVWIETLSFRITDSMCGFRIYPIQETISVFNEQSIGARMDFDTEIMVRLFWKGTPVIMSPVRVSYPPGNLSNFDILQDNWRITKMHTKLFFTMLISLSKILRSRPNYKMLNFPKEFACWVSMEERGALIGLFILAWCYRLAGKRFCLILGMPIVVYYYIKEKAQRQASHDFLKRVFTFQKKREPTFIDGLRHFMNFFEMALDKFASWIGHVDVTKLNLNGREGFKKLMGTGQGGMMIVSHLGNMEFCRAISSADHKNRMHILLHTKNSQRFHRFLKAFNPQSNLNLIEVTDLGPDTILYLKDRILAGDWVVIAGDRVPVTNNGRVSLAPFLGKEAPFSQGPYILASLLECSLYTAFAIRDRQKFHIFLDLFHEKVILDRQDREKTLRILAKKYAERLESYTLAYPYQWFNFFDFWHQPTSTSLRERS
jgi:predicted LPLAT superfamily acyltransferase